MTRYLKLFSLFFVMVTQASWVVAAEKQSWSALSPLESEMIFKMFFSLTLVLLIVLAIAWLVRRMQSIKWVGNSNMKVLATLPLGATERLMIVQVGQMYLLLGVSPSGVQSLHEFDELPSGLANHPQEILKFSQVFKNIFNKNLEREH